MPERPARQGFAARRVTIATAAGAAALVGSAVGGAGWTVAVTAGWCVCSATIVASVWLRIGRMDAATTAAHARAEDFSRAAADAIVLTASTASLAAVGLTLVEAGNGSGTRKALLILLAVVAVALSWATVHTIYAVRYGDLYYDPPVGGVEFNEGEPPDYRDFAYLALTIGMTFQVSDTNLTTKQLRRAATTHALLSYLFGAVIVALAINAVASLLQR